MIPISLTWDTREKSILIKWNGFFSYGWKNGKRTGRVFKIPILRFPSPKRSLKAFVPRRRWIGLKEVLSFVKEWKLKRAEGTFSFQDPMVNGVLFGWMTALAPKGESQKIHLTVNFLGKNWCSGELTVSPQAVFHHLKRWFLLYFKKGRKLRKGG
ncbi:MAG: hypothetical protein ACUVWO_05945 [Thermodesulfobacteriota bacterium]